MSKNEKLGSLEHLAQMQNLKSVGINLIRHVCFESAVAQQLPKESNFTFSCNMNSAVQRTESNPTPQDKVLMVDQSLL